MEIKIKTLAEVQSDHVIVEINGSRLYASTEVGQYQANEAELETDRLVTSMNSRRLWDEDSLYTREMVICLQASEAELVSAPLRKRITELEARLEKARLEKGDAYRRVIELTSELAEQRQSLEASNRLLIKASTEAREAEERATENRAWAERAESRLVTAGMDLADARRAIEILSNQLGRVSEAVHGSEVREAMRPMYCAPETVVLRNSVQSVRDALGSPGPPTPPGPATSQA